MANKMKLAVLAVVGLASMSGCTSNLHRPEIAEASPTKDGVFFLDLRKSFAQTSEEKEITSELLETNCKLQVNVGHPVCREPEKFAIYNGQLRNGMWGKGPVFYGVYIPKDLQVTAFAPPSEKDGDIVRAKVIPGPVSMLAYDGVIERYDDPNRACYWKGTHNYSGGVVCEKYGYDHKRVDYDKM